MKEKELTDRHFIEWEESIFGYGYGSGEPYIFEAVKTFFNLVPYEGYYDYIKMEKKLTPTVFWLLVNIFSNYEVDVLDYGSSTRFA